MKTLNFGLYPARTTATDTPFTRLLHSFRKNIRALNFNTTPISIYIFMSNIQNILEAVSISIYLILNVIIFDFIPYLNTYMDVL